MKKKILATFGDNVLNFLLPDSWEKLTQEQLRYVCYAMSRFEDVVAKTYLFIRLTGIHVLKKTNEHWLCLVKIKNKNIRFYLYNWQIESFIQILNFIDDPGCSPVRLLHVGKLLAVNPLLRGISFNEYIKLENYYQGYLHTGRTEHLTNMARLLYVTSDGQHPIEVRFADHELLSVFIWYAALKNRFSQQFPYFFRSGNTGNDSEPVNMIDVMNAEIRALTGGDITKENQVLNMDCWRALTELNEKARETLEFNDKYGHK